MIHESLKKFMDGFNYDAHPMGMLIATVAAMSTFYPDARNIHDPASRTKQTYRLIAKMPTLAAFAYRHSLGMPYVYPDNDLSYTENFLNMLFKMPAARGYRPNSTLVKALDVLFILHADHEQNCGTNVMRSIGSSHADPYSAVAGAAAALYGPLHGGANEEVLKMLAGDRLDRARAGLHRGGQAGQGREAPDGLRPPRLQELRSRGPRSSSGWPKRCSR